MAGAGVGACDDAIARVDLDEGTTSLKVAFDDDLVEDLLDTLTGLILGSLVATGAGVGSTGARTGAATVSLTWT
jgi:hypothetical protein